MKLPRQPPPFLARCREDNPVPDDVRAAMAASGADMRTALPQPGDLVPSDVARHTAHLIQSTLAAAPRDSPLWSHMQVLLNAVLLWRLVELVREAPRDEERDIPAGANRAAVEVLMSSVVCDMAFHFFLTPDRLDVQDADTFKSRGRGKSKDTKMLVVSYQDVRRLIALVSDKTKCYEVRTNVLVALRHLLKSPKVHGLIYRADGKKKKKADSFSFLDGFFATALNEWCRDGENRQFNRNAWRLFFQLFRYHAGQAQVLGPIMDAISPMAGPVVNSHGLYYLAKIFTMAQLEQGRAIAGKRTARDPKGMEKDMRSMADLVSGRKLFVKLHMLYKSTPQDGAGPAFVALANVYRVIQKQPACSKLLKVISKDQDYRAGLEHLASLFGAGEGKNWAGTLSRKSMHSSQGSATSPSISRGTSQRRLGSFLPGL